MSSTEGVNPFQGELWETARRMIRSAPQEGLSQQQMLTLVDKATEDGVVTDAERRLLQAVVDPENVQRMARHLRSRTPFDASALNFAHPRTQALERFIQAGLAGDAIGDQYVPANRIDLRRIEAAKATPIGSGQPLDFTTPAGRDAILNRYGQLMGLSVYGSQACGAASVMALAIHAGPRALSQLATLVANYDGGPAITELATRLRQLADARPGQPQPAFTLGDLAILQDHLMMMMQGEQINADVAAGRIDGEPDQGLRPQTIVNFVQNYQRELSAIVSAGAILPIDNTGDGALDHFVAVLRRPDGNVAVYEPWERQDGRHLITDTATLETYARARAVF